MPRPASRSNRSRARQFLSFIVDNPVELLNTGDSPRAARCRMGASRPRVGRCKRVGGCVAGERSTPRGNGARSGKPADESSTWAACGPTTQRLTQFSACAGCAGRAAARAWRASAGARAVTKGHLTRVSDRRCGGAPSCPGWEMPVGLHVRPADVWARLQRDTGGSRREREAAARGQEAVLSRTLRILAGVEKARRWPAGRGRLWSRAGEWRATRRPPYRAVAVPGRRGVGGADGCRQRPV